MPTVLIADDSAFMRKIIRQTLENNGYSVAAEASSGAECIEKYIEFKPDVVTLDVTMSDMSGISTLKKLKTFDSNAKVIMISSLGQEFIIKEAILNGAETFIVKPFKAEHIISAVKKLTNAK